MISKTAFLQGYGAVLSALKNNLVNKGVFSNIGKAFSAAKGALPAIAEGAKAPLFSHTIAPALGAVKNVATAGMGAGDLVKLRRMGIGAGIFGSGMVAGNMLTSKEAAENYINKVASAAAGGRVFGGGVATTAKRIWGNLRDTGFSKAVADKYKSLMGTKKYSPTNALKSVEHGLIRSLPEIDKDRWKKAKKIGYGAGMGGMLYGAYRMGEGTTSNMMPEQQQNPYNVQVIYPSYSNVQ